MTEFRDVLEEITRDLREIFKRLDDLSIGPASIYTLPTPGTMYNHLEDDGTTWQSRANLTIAATAHIGAHGVRAALANADGLYVPWENGDTDATMRVGSLDISNNQNAIEAFTDSGYGVQAVSTDTVGVQGSSTTGTGVEGISSSGAGGNFRSATGAGLVVNLTGAGTAIADFNDNGISVFTINDGGSATVSDDFWLGLGAAAGRIEFDNQAMDEINFLNCWVGIGTSTPGTPLDVDGTGNLATFGSGAGAATVFMDGAAGQVRQVVFRTNGSDRWYVRANNTAEGGANAGTDLELRRRSDAGADLGVAFFIERSSGYVGISSTAPGSLMEWNFADEDLEFADCHTATSVSTVEAVVEVVTTTGATGYIPIYSSYS